MGVAVVREGVTEEGVTGEQTYSGVDAMGGG
jgi:hypothetical protein